MNGDTPQAQPGQTPPEQPVAAPPTPPAPTVVPAPDATPWQYSAGGDVLPANEGFNVPMPPQPNQEVTWSASEFIEHGKDFTWYAYLVVATLALVFFVYLFTHDIISIVAVMAMAILFGVMASRKPRVLTYTLDHEGLTIGDKFHPYVDFKSYSVNHEGAFSSISFMPMKRLRPPVSVYYAVEDEERIAEVLTQFLPMQMRQADVVDKLARGIRF
jgi:hypothetical protein